MTLVNNTITILLATYNGEKYIGHQLESIINQTYDNWQLVIRDDNSNDNTLAVIEKYKKQYPDKIIVLENRGKNKGSLFNFSMLLQEASKARYIMFCDQDDEWKENKIEKTFSKMLDLEKQYGENYALMIFTDFLYVDKNLKTIASKKNFTINKIKDFSFPHLLANNPVYGCTTMINRSLADKIGVIPSQAGFHDHWIALIASAIGKLYYLNEKTILYRQHASNVSGNFDNDSFRKRFKRIVIDKKNFKDARDRYSMLMTFKKIYYNDLSSRYKSVLDTFLSLFPSKNPLTFLKSIRNGVICQTLAPTFLLYVTIFFVKSPSES